MSNQFGIADEAEVMAAMTGQEQDNYAYWQAQIGRAERIMANARKQSAKIRRAVRRRIRNSQLTANM